MTALFYILSQLPISLSVSLILIGWSLKDFYSDRPNLYKGRGKRVFWKLLITFIMLLTTAFAHLT